ncbi:MAG: flagellar biosynthesis protein FlhB [Acidimicrobiia bacterium]
MALGDQRDKTEKPTPKRKREARKEGRVAKSQDLVTWTSVLVATFLLPGTLTRGAEFERTLFGRVHEAMLEPSPDKMTAAGAEVVLGVGGLLAPILFGMVLIAIVGNVGQVGFVLSTKAIKPSLKRLNPIAGFKQLFSAKSAFELGKSMTKLAIIGAIAYPAIRGINDSLPHDHTLPFWEMAAMVGQGSLSLLRRVAYGGLLVSIVDFGYQKRSIMKSLKMTKQEVRDEAKQSEGPQEVKSKIKAKQREISRNRMLMAVAKADVVVVNPVHIAVALRYEPMLGAPRVIAKGEGWVAERIRAEADKHQVPIVESIPLARALYAAVELSDEIGAEFYEPVARLLAFVHRIGKRRPLGGGHHRLPDGLVQV